uniref:CSON000571 protein n=1 Tax=Culicoides sonorensis TaxID=179676 RepID=A0A336LZ36_CULSO
MAQGNKMKTKANLPANVKQKKKQGQTFNRRKNAPAKQKKIKHMEAHKLKEIVSKAVNQNIEEEMRRRAYEGQTSFSKVQEVVAKHHKSKETNSEAGTSSMGD